MYAPTWADWFSSRTIKFNLFMGAVWTAALPVIALIDESTLTDLGLDRQWVVGIAIAVKLLEMFAKNRLRSTTTQPLVGRASTGPGF